MIKYSNIFFVLILICFTPGMSSCTSAPIYSASNIPLNNKDISENLGKVDGTGRSTFTLFSLWMMGMPDIQGAIDDALSKKNGDALINIKCYEKSYNFLLFGLTSVKIEADAVKLMEIENGDKNAVPKK